MKENLGLGSGICRWSNDCQMAPRINSIFWLDLNLKIVNARFPGAVLLSLRSLINILRASLPEPLDSPVDSRACNSADSV